MAKEIKAIKSIADLARHGFDYGVQCNPICAHAIPFGSEVYCMNEKYKYDLCSRSSNYNACRYYKKK